MADPPTPPHTPASSSKGTPNVIQGDVNYTGLQNDGGVITGNVAGFNTIVGTLNLTVDSAADLTNNIQSFTARVATAAERLRDAETRIRATSQLLSSIRDLVIARAAKEGINIGRDFKLQDGEQTETGSVNSPNDGGNATGEGERGGVDPSQPRGTGGTVPGPTILEKPCFRDLVNASQSAADRFERINIKIHEAFSSIEPMQRGRPKVELSEDDRMKFFLTERDIDDMERHIESHKLEVHIALTAFEATMGDKRSEAIQLVILEMFKEIQRIGEYFFNRNRTSPQPPQDPHRSNPIFDPYSWQRTYHHARPFIFPDLSRLTSLYLGWTFTKGRPPYVQINTSTTQSSWRWAICSQMALSTEELFLKVLAQTTKRSKLRRTIQDDCKDLLKTSTQRMLVDNLLREQNENLSIHYPFLALKLAGLSCKTRRIGFFTHETKSINVILKTEWDPDHPRHGPIPPGGGGGPPPPPPGFGGPPYGPGRRLGGGGGGNGPGYPPGGGHSDTIHPHGPGHTSQGPQHTPQHTPGQAKPFSKSHSQPEVHHSHPHVTPTISDPEIVSREPRMYIVRKKDKSKTTEPDNESTRRVFVRDRHGHRKIEIENRRPTSSHTDYIDGPSTSARPDHAPPPPPPPGPYNHFYKSHAQEQYIPAHSRTRVPVPPPPPPPRPFFETVYSSDTEPREFFQRPSRPAPESMHPPTQEMTHEQEKKVIDEIFAEWEDGVHGTPTSPSNTNATRKEKEKMEREDRANKNRTSSAHVPRIGPTRRMMLEVEHEAQTQEKIEKMIRETHVLEEPDYQRSHSFEKERRYRSGVDVSTDSDVDSEKDKRYSETERYYQNPPGHPEVIIPGPSRRHESSAPEIHVRERQYVRVDGADPLGPSERRNEYFGIPIVDHLPDDPESHGRVRLVPPRMRERERERPRVVMTQGLEPERPSTERVRRIIETRSPRAMYESVSEESSFEESE